MDARQAVNTFPFPPVVQQTLFAGDTPALYKPYVSTVLHVALLAD
jgi:hypothetical protein